MTGQDSKAVARYIASIYHHMLGSDYHEQLKFALTQLQRILGFDASYWATLDVDGVISQVVTVDMDQNCKRRLDRVLKGKRVVQRFGEVAKNRSADYSFLNCAVDRVCTEAGPPMSMVEATDEREVHLLVLLPRDPIENVPDSSDVRFLFCRALHSLKLNRYLRYRSDRLRPNSYKAFCSADFSIVDAEKNFLKLLNQVIPDAITERKFCAGLSERLGASDSFSHKGIVFSVSRFKTHNFVEIYFDDPRMRNLTAKRLEVIRWIYLDRGAIAERLNMNIRTLDDHFAAIYDEFGTREKKKILAETHQYPDVELLKKLQGLR